MQKARLRLSSAKQAASLNAAIVKGANPDPSLSKIYGFIVDSHGEAILDGKDQKIKVSKGTKGNSGLPGVGRLTPNEIHNWMAKAGNVARNVFNGTTTKDGVFHPPLDWKHAVAQMALDGIPVSIAEQALRKVGYMPGVRSAPPLNSGNGRRSRRKH